ncbi:MAG: lysine N(6)-hydroxylase/L-ornithine N(5)-oxygenase family protein [Aquisalimonadaceae bacterium]
MRDSIYDFAGIGLGPFNLGLACLTAPIAGLDGVFLDESERFDWHPGMLLEGATLQTPFMADLVTMADPTSPYSFLNYSKQQGRLYSFYIRENFFLLRNEFNQYCQWAANQLPNIEFGTRVERIDHDARRSCYVIQATCITTGKTKTWSARKLVLGTGAVPYIPESCQPLINQAPHSSSYLNHRQELQSRRSITVLGSGQSAAEIYFDLLQDIDKNGYELNWITRSPRFFPLEYSKLTLEMTSPEYVDYFYGLPAHKRDRLIRRQKNLYKGIDDDLICAIRDLLYEKRLLHPLRTRLLTNSELKTVAFDARQGRFDLNLYQSEQEQPYTISTEGLVLATGYTYQIPPFIEGIQSRIRWDNRGRFEVCRNYSIDRNESEIFVQNAELHSHGFVTPDLGMGCYRNACIIREMTGREHYPIETEIAFQRFSALKDAEGLSDPARPMSTDQKSPEVC